jgi:hypothetical protein
MLGQRGGFRGPWWPTVGNALAAGMAGKKYSIYNQEGGRKAINESFWGRIDTQGSSLISEDSLNIYHLIFKHTQQSPAQHREAMDPEVP